VVLSVSALKYWKNISRREGKLPSRYFALYFFNLIIVDALFSEIDFQRLDNDTRGVPTTTPSLCSKHKCLAVLLYITIFILIITIFILFFDELIVCARILQTLYLSRIVSTIDTTDFLVKIVL